jgi:hypothetical protein
MRKQIIKELYYLKRNLLIQSKNKNMKKEKGKTLVLKLY